jgi:hypothetical protein
MEINRLRSIIRESISNNLKEIEDVAENAAMEAKLNAYTEAIDKVNKKIEMAESLEEMQELVDPTKLNELKKHLKTLEKSKEKLEKVKAKKNKGKEVVTDEPVEEAEVEEGNAMGMDNAIVPEMNNAVSIYKNTANETKNVYTSFNNDLAAIKERSGYNKGFKAYNDAVNELKNNPDKDVRDAYRFITIQAQMLDSGSDATATERMANLSEDDREFIRTVGKDLQLNKKDLLSSVYTKAENVYNLAVKARNLFPEKELKEYEAKNSYKLDEQMAKYKQQEGQIKQMFADPKIAQLLNDITRIQQNAEGDTFSDNYYFPTPSDSTKSTKSWLSEIHPAFGLAVGAVERFTSLARAALVILPFSCNLLRIFRSILSGL